MSSSHASIARRLLVGQACLLALACSTVDEESEPCSVPVNWADYFNPDSQLAEDHDALEVDVTDYLTRDLTAGPAYDLGTVVIPVVVHVILDCPESDSPTPESLVPPEIVDSQIAALNRDFGDSLDWANPHCYARYGEMGPDCTQMSLAAPPCLGFVLAARDPYGKPTSGIEYCATTDTPTWDIKATPNGPKCKVPPWPRDSYLNIWVVDMESGVLGQSSFPAEPASQDGIIVDRRAFGDFATLGVGAPDQNRNYGRTAAHEIGHWLDLYHLWGSGGTGDCSGDDEVGDTPPQKSDHAMCTGNDNSCDSDEDGNIENPPLFDLCHSFMDYSYDKYRHIFTAGQVERMRATLCTARRRILGSAGHIPPVAGGDAWIADSWADVGDEAGVAPASGFVFNSPDIWMRNRDDGTHDMRHQQPNRSGSDQYIYVRVRNRGTDRVTNATLKVYWALANTGLGWPDPWESPAGPDALGGLIFTQLVTVEAGASVIASFKWAPPVPPSDADLGASTPAFSLLARIETAPTLPYGMSQPEVVGDLLANVAANNNIACRSVWVVGEPVASTAANDEASTIVVAANHTAALQTVRVVVSEPNAHAALPLARDTENTIRTDQLLAQKLKTGRRGRQKPDSGVLLELGPFELAPGEVRRIALDIDSKLLKTLKPGNHGLLVQQFVEDGGTSKLVGSGLIGLTVPKHHAKPPKAKSIRKH